MARLPRLYAPGIVQHIVQRAIDGRRLFVDADDYALFVDLLEEAVRVHALELHAYVLLPDEVRLLGTPRQAESTARVMQAIGRRFVPHMNRRTSRSGPLWDRRYRSTLIDADEYLIASMRHIERKPVAAALVDAPSEWRWSSYGHHVGLEQQTLIRDHPLYWALSDAPFERQAAYRAIADRHGDGDLETRIETAVDRGWVFGSAAFASTVEGQANRRVGPLPRGRPRKGTT